MISQPIRAICILLAILAIVSCNNSTDKTQPFEATALDQPSPRRQFGDKPVPAGHIHVSSNYHTAVALRPVPVSSKTTRDVYGNSKQNMTYHLSELPNPTPNNFVAASSDPYPALSFLG